MSIKTLNKKIININKNSIAKGNDELILKRNKDIIIDSSDNVLNWSYPENNWFFVPPSGKEPTFDTNKNAVRFTQSNDEKLVGNKPFNYLEPHFVSMYIWVNSLPNNTNVFYSIRDFGNTYFRFHLTKIDVNTFYISYYAVQSGNINIGTTRWSNQGAIFDIGEWYHLMFYVDGTDVIIWVNGALNNWNYGASRTINPELPIYLGGRQPYTASSFDGWIDDIKISKNSNSFLTTWTIQAQYSQIYIPPPRSCNTTPILQLKANTIANQSILMDASSNVNQWNDIRGKHHPYSVSGHEPLYDFSEQSILFDNANTEHLRFYPPNGDLNINNNWATINLMFKRNGNHGTNNILIMNGNGSSSSDFNYMIGINTSDYIYTRLYRSGSGIYDVIYYTAITDTNWHYVTVIYEPSETHRIAHLIVDGYYRASGGLINPVNDLIGRAFTLSGYLDSSGVIQYCFKGYLDDISFRRGSGQLISSYSINDQVFTPKSRNFPRL